MDARKLVLPAMALVGGAVLGRLIGFRGLVRAGLAVVTVAEMSKSAGLLTQAGRISTPDRDDRSPAKRVQRPARKRAAAKKSTRRKTASAAARARAH